MSTDPKEPISPETAATKTLTPFEHIFAGLPLLLVFMGGAIGGMCGGAGYACSTMLFKKNLPIGLKYLLSTLIAVASIGLYFGVILVLVTVFPGVFQKQ